MAAGPHGLDPATVDDHALGRRAQMDTAALASDVVGDGLYQRFRPAIDVAKLLLEHRLARVTDALYRGCDPGSRNLVGKFVEFEFLQPFPQLVVNRLAGAA